MGRYDDVVAFLKRVENPKGWKMNLRDRKTEREIDDLRARFPNAPEDYFYDLSEIGAAPRGSGG